MKKLFTLIALLVSVFAVFAVFNANNDVEAAEKIVAGSARNMGIAIKD